MKECEGSGPVAEGVEPVKRPRGAPLQNNNALSHGLHVDPKVEKKRRGSHDMTKPRSAKAMREAKRAQCFAAGEEKAKQILIIGGGLVGAELAAEIVTHYKDKEVIICQAGNKILNRNTDKVIKYAEKWLRKRGVKILYKSKVIKSEKNIYITEQGKKITPDMAFMCVGIVPNSKLLKKNFPQISNIHF